MLFGFTMAVVAGFLLTAGSNWTGRDVASGRALLLLALLWLAGRVAPLVPVFPGWVVAAVDLAFVPTLALVLGVALFETRSRRNYLFLVLLSVLFSANVLFHAENAGEGVRDGIGRDLALRMIALMILVVGGRVFPMFTRNATRVSSIRNVAALDRIAIGAALVATLLELAPVPRAVLAVTWIVAGLLNAVRMVSWGTRFARARLLWILHAGYFAAALSFVLQGLAYWGVVPPAAAVHCFTIGCIGLLTLGMMARVSLGHSGRLLVAPRSLGVAFATLTISAVVRVCGSIFYPMELVFSWHLSGVLWAAAFLLFLLFGTPIWFRPRADT